MKNILFAVVIFLMLQPLYCAVAEDVRSEPVISRTFLDYSREFPATDRYSMGMCGSLYKRLCVEATLIGLTRIKNDPHNNSSTNYSPAALIATGMTLSLAKMLTLLGVEEASNYSKIPILLSNTMFYLPLLQDPYNLDLKGRVLPSLYLAPFVKNDTDLFLFRKNVWGQISPGAGIRLYLMPSYEVGFAVGYQYNISTDFKGRPQTEGSYFLRVGLNSPME